MKYTYLTFITILILQIAIPVTSSAGESLAEIRHAFVHGDVEP